MCFRIHSFVNELWEKFVFHGLHVHYHVQICAWNKTYAMPWMCCGQTSFWVSQTGYWPDFNFERFFFKLQIYLFIKNLTNFVPRFSVSPSSFTERGRENLGTRLVKFFINKYIFNLEKKLSKLKSGQNLAWRTQKPRKGYLLKGVNTRNLSGKNAPPPSPPPPPPPDASRSLALD